jgi:signal transduction histidine kinase/CheY-like chemotaxis protein
MINEKRKSAKRIDLLKMVVTIILTATILALLLISVAGISNVHSAASINELPGSPRIGVNLAEYGNFDFANDLLVLDCDWMYYPDVLLFPSDFINGFPPDGVDGKDVGVPHRWRKETRRNDLGYATYRTVVTVPENISGIYGAGVFTPFQYGAFQIFLNGTPVVSSGRISEDRNEHYFAFTGGVGFTNPSRGDTYEIIVHIQGFDHEDAGLSINILFGSHDVIRDYFTLITSATGITTGAVLVLMIYFLLIFIRNKDKKEYLNFVIVSLCCVFLTITNSGSNIAYHAVPTISVNVIYTFEFLAYIVGAYFATIHVIQKYIKYKNAKLIALIYASVIILLIIILSSYQLSRLRTQMQIASFVPVFIALTFSFLNAIGKNPGSQFGSHKPEKPLLEFISLIILFGGLGISTLGFTPWYGFSMIPVFTMIYCFMQIFLLTHRDNQTEKNLRKLNKQLENRVAERTKRLADLNMEVRAANDLKNEFLTLMSHEIRTPMNAIVGISDLFENENLTDTQKLYFNNIKETSQALLSLINDVMDFSKMDSGQLESTPSNFSIKDFVENISASAGYIAKTNGLNFEVNVSEDLPDYILGDEVRIKQVIVNIIKNAVKYTREGSVTLDVKATAKPGSRESMLLFTISDTGSGYSKESLEHLFNVFTHPDTMKQRGISGTGLAMTICKQITELLKGKIEVESEIDKGSVFKVYFPLVIGEKLIIEETIVTEKIQAGNAKVLMVEDSEINVTVITGIFAMHGIRPDIAPDGETALEMVQKKDYDLIFMDQFMPGMDGIETTQKIRELGGKFSSLPIIALTANKLPGARDMMIFKGMNDYLAKPVDQKMFNNLLVRWLPHDKIGKTLGKFEDEIQNSNEPVGTVNELPRELVEITELNCADALKNMDGNVRTYIKILRRLVDEADKYIENIYDYLKISDLVNYGIVMNGFKSLLYSVGAKSCGDTASRLEAAATENNAKYCQEKNVAFCDSLKWLVQRISLSLPIEARFGVMETVSEVSDEAPLQTDNEQKLAGIMQDLSFSLSKNDEVGILKHIADLNAYLPVAGMEYKEMLTSITEDTKASDYTKAAQTCKKVLQMVLEEA